MTVTDLLIVGTFGGGGIHQYVEEQRRQLEGRLDVSVYDMYSEGAGSGVGWFLRSVLLAAWAALRFPLRSPADVVHVHTSHRFSFVRAAYYVLVAKWLWRRPVVLHVHGSSFDEFVEDPSWPIARLQDAVFGASDAVIVLSAYWARTLSESVRGDRIHVVPNAVSPAAYEAEAGATPPHVVFLSNLVDRKGVREFVAAVDDLYDRGAAFRTTVAGAGPLAGEVEALEARHDDVEYRGYVSEAEKRALLSSASIYALPTYAEGLPIAMLEAMAGGNAVVSTAVGSIPEVVGTENGRLVDPGDEAALADALAELVAAPEAVAEMGRRNHAAVRERYSWKRAIETLLSVYDEVAGDATAEGPGQPRTGTASGSVEPSQDPDVGR